MYQNLRRTRLRGMQIGSATCTCRSRCQLPAEQLMTSREGGECDCDKQQAIDARGRAEVTSPCRRRRRARLEARPAHRRAPRRRPAISMAFGPEQRPARRMRTDSGPRRTASNAEPSPPHRSAREKSPQRSTAWVNRRAPENTRGSTGIGSAGSIAHSDRDREKSRGRSFGGQPRAQSNGPLLRRTPRSPRVPQSRNR